MTAYVTTDPKAEPKVQLTQPAAIVNDRAVPSVGELWSERRRQRRYPIDLLLHYKLFQRGRAECQGCGHTLNIGSGGVLFETDSLATLSPGSYLQLAIHWPMLLGGHRPLKLVMSGRIVWRMGRFVAIHADQYEFKTGPAHQTVPAQSNRAHTTSQCNHGAA